MEQIELYREFERVIVDPEHDRREADEEREEAIRTSGNGAPPAGRSLPQPLSYAQRILHLIARPHEQWDETDRALATRVVEDARYRQDTTEHERRELPETEPAPQKRRVIRDEFDRRLWGLPSRPRLSQR